MTDTIFIQRHPIFMTSIGWDHVAHGTTGRPAPGIQMDLLEGMKVVDWMLAFPFNPLALCQITC